MKRYPWAVSYGNKYLDRTIEWTRSLLRSRQVPIPSPQNSDSESGKSVLVFILKVIFNFWMAALSFLVNVEIWLWFGIGKMFLEIWDGFENHEIGFLDEKKTRLNSIKMKPNNTILNFFSVLNIIQELMSLGWRIQTSADISSSIFTSSSNRNVQPRLSDPHAIFLMR